MPSVAERPTIEDGTLITPSNLTTTLRNTTATHVVNDADGVPVETYSEKVKPPESEPIHYGGTEDRPTSAFLERVACCHCAALCLEGQRD